MQSYVDRNLICMDCHSEFVFTAGEQLFFADKQFKNDPKRCKPCKSRRSGLAAAANGLSSASASVTRTETRTLCSACGIETTVPFKPTQGRPVLCRQCFQLKGRAALPSAPAALPPAPVPALPLTLSSEVVALTMLSTNPQGASLSPDAAVLAAASMSSASPLSSVATPAELALIAAGGNAAQPEASRKPAFVNPTLALIRRSPLEALKTDAALPELDESDLRSLPPCEHQA